MSEYQYYEFQTIDRRLSEREMQQLRAYSSRAEITPTSFVNAYSFGNFKGDSDAWMEKYFDAFLYVANWGTHEFRLRLPEKLLSLKTARQFCSGDPASARAKSGKVIVTFLSQEEGGGEWIEGNGRLASLLPVRDEIARGDLRALYLGWLCCVQEGDLDETSLEPPVPANLGHLSGALSSLAEFLRIDPDLLAVAAQTSSTSQPATEANDEDLARWLATLPSAEKDGLLMDVIKGKSAAMGMDLGSRFYRQQSAGRANETPARRTVNALLTAAESFGEKREEQEARAAALGKARNERKAAKAREQHLDSIAGQTNELWKQVGQLLSAGQGTSYDLAVRLLVDLRDLAAREGTQSDFAERLAPLRKLHGQRAAVSRRMKEKGL